MRRLFLFFVLVCVVIMAGCIEQEEEDTSENDNKTEEQEVEKYEQGELAVNTSRYVENIEAFAKLYGYVRFFHPSDEVASLSSYQWDQFAVYGVGEVKHAKNDDELKIILEDIFFPVAPTLQVYLDGEKPDTINQEITAEEVIAWQHFGYESPDIPAPPYLKGRIIKNLTTDELVEPLLDEFPRVDEVIEEQISSELYVSIPLTLYKNDEGTIGSTEESTERFKQLKNTLRTVIMDIENEDIRFAGMIVTWNVMQHFYPYFHVTDSDWGNQLKPALENTVDDETRDDYIYSIMSLLEKTEDGHAIGTNEIYQQRGKRLPFIMDQLGDSIVVTAVEEDSVLEMGDQILSIDGENPHNLMENLKEYIPGSIQLKNYAALDWLRKVDVADLVVKRGEETLNVQVKGELGGTLDEFNRDSENPFQEIEDGIYYLNLNHNISLENHINELRTAKGIIFDLRGYPYKFDYIHEIIGRLTKEPAQGSIGKIMKTIRPNQEQVAYEEITTEMDIEPLQPYFEGKAVFLSYAGSISQPEFFLSYVKQSELGTIVGQPTAGADGNITSYSIPGHITGIFTGMEFLNADGSQSHLKGILPDVYVERTLEGIMNGEDEYIMKALEVIKE